MVEGEETDEGEAEMTTFNTGLRTSNTPEWATPQDFFDELDEEFGFTLDVCATPENAKCERYFTEADDGLAQDWSGEVCWMNPPYGRVIGGWMRKAYEESQKGATVVCLVPARTDTAWWWDTAMKVWPHGIRLVRGRLKFGDGQGSAPFPSAVVVFGQAPHIDVPCDYVCDAHLDALRVCRSTIEEGAR